MSSAPFGLPVVPLVYSTMTVSSPFVAVTCVHGVAVVEQTIEADGARGYGACARDDQMAARADAGRSGLRLREQGGSGHERDRVAVVEVIRDLVRRQQRVQRHDGAADVGGAEVCDRKLRRVRQQQRHVLTARKTRARAARPRNAARRRAARHKSTCARRTRARCGLRANEHSHATKSRDSGSHVSPANTIARRLGLARSASAEVLGGVFAEL